MCVCLETDVKLHEVKLTAIKRERDKSTIIVETSTSTLSVIHRSSRQKISKDTNEVNNTTH